MSEPFVLLIGLDSDLHLDAGVLELRKRGIKFIRIDPSRINRENTKIDFEISGESSSTTIETYAGQFDTSTITGVWCRYGLDLLDGSSDDQYVQFGNEELFSILKASLLTIHSEYWINDSFIEARADHKPLQLTLARHCGLKIPETIISNSKQQLEAFLRHHEDCLIKPIGDSCLVESRQNGLFGNFASKLTIRDLSNIEWDYTCPTLLQKCIDKSADIRATVVDDHVFAVAMKLGHQDIAENIVDFRNAKHVSMIEIEIPPEVEGMLIHLNRMLGIRFSSCDLCLKDGEYYFLEANVAGNYLWTELDGLMAPKITEAIIDGLLRNNAPQRDPGHQKLLATTKSSVLAST